MKSKRLQRLNECLEQHRKSVSLWKKKQGDADFLFLGLSKSFEILVEYAWKILKYKVEDEGLDAPSPKDAVRKAAQIALIDDPQLWIDCINARNDSVHDYFGISKEKYIELATQMVDLTQSLLNKLQ